MANCDENGKYPDWSDRKFYSKIDGEESAKIHNFWRIPQMKEINKLDNRTEELKKELDVDSFYTLPEKLNEN